MTTLAECYTLFHLDQSASFDDIKKKYKELVKQTHPDLNPGKDSKEFLKIQDSYDFLLKNHKQQTNEIKDKKIEKELIYTLPSTIFNTLRLPKDACINEEFILNCMFRNNSKIFKISLPKNTKFPKTVELVGLSLHLIK